MAVALSERAVSVHLEHFPTIPDAWRDDALAAKWEKIRKIRSVVTGALEIERAQKRIGSSLEAAPIVYIADESLRAALEGVDFAEICIASDIRVYAGRRPAGGLPPAGSAGRRRGSATRRRRQMRALVEIFRSRDGATRIIPT